MRQMCQDCLNGHQEIRHSKVRGDPGALLVLGINKERHTATGVPGFDISPGVSNQIGTAKLDCQVLGGLP